jgi:hypothetical protein
MMETIVAEVIGNEKHVAIYKDNNKIIFSYNLLFDAETDERDFGKGEFAIDKYKRGVNELNKNGFSKIEGENCTLEMKKDKRNGLDMILFKYDEKTSLGYGKNMETCITCSADKLIIK